MDGDVASLITDSKGAAKKALSVIVPAFNERGNVGAMYEALCGVAATIPDLDWEFLFVDDGSTDESFALLSKMSEADPRVKAVKLSRNYGAQTAATAGLHFAAGDAAVIIPCDLQDHPREIPRLIAKWREGFHVVWGVRALRQDSWLDQVTSRLAGALIRRIALPNFPSGGAGLYLIDRLVIEALNAMPERNRMSVGLTLMSGFRQAHVPYDRLERHSGGSKWSIGRRMGLLIDILVSFSVAPIRIASLTGVVISLLSLIYIAYMIVDRLIYSTIPAGWTTTVVLVAFFGGLQLATLGILGEYLWRALDDIRRRPLYLVQETRGYFPRYQPPLPPRVEAGLIPFAANPGKPEGPGSK